MVDIQRNLQQILEQELKNNRIEMYKHEKEHKEGLPKLTKKGINYTIVIAAASDIETSSVFMTRDFFEKIDKLYSPEKMGILSLKEEQKQVEDILKNLFAEYVSPGTGFPSVRLPGTTTFFRAVDLGQMEIITWLKLQALRLDKILLPQSIKQLEQKRADIVAHESSLEMASATQREQELSTQIAQAKKALKESATITIPVKPGTKYIQIFPCNLMDCCIDIQASKIPQFVSKIPGQAQHFIGKIKINGKGDPTQVLKNFVEQGSC